jgi:hypothetical protein
MPSPWIRASTQEREPISRILRFLPTTRGILLSVPRMAALATMMANGRQMKGLFMQRPLFPTLAPHSTPPPRNVRPIVFRRMGHETFFESLASMRTAYEMETETEMETKLARAIYKACFEI